MFENCGQKIVVNRRHIFFPFITRMEARLSVNIRNVNNVEHMEIVNTSAEGASLELLVLTWIRKRSVLYIRIGLKREYKLPLNPLKQVKDCFVRRWDSF